MPDEKLKFKASDETEDDLTDCEIEELREQFSRFKELTSFGKSDRVKYLSDETDYF